MDGAPPPFAEYPRNSSSPGSAAKLQSLMEGYYGYGPLFAIHVVLTLILRVASLGLGPNGLALYGLGVLVIMIVMGLASYRVNAKVGFGAGWSQTQVVLACVMIALGTICFGIIGYIILQTIAANHIKMYGVRSGCMGIKKKAIQARIAELQASGG